MKVQLITGSTSGAFTIELTPENADEKDTLITLSESGRYTLQFSGHQYMRPEFRFYGYVPSSN